jgi:Domain of unknown function (DUF4148)
MNVKTAIAFIATAAAVFASPVFAGTSADNGAPLTREAVRAEAIRARAAGELDFTEVNYPREQVQTAPGLTRAQVHAEVLRARAAGELDINEASPNYPSH